MDVDLFAVLDEGMQLRVPEDGFEGSVLNKDDLLSISEVIFRVGYTYARTTCGYVFGERELEKMELIR